MLETKFKKYILPILVLLLAAGAGYYIYINLASTKGVEVEESLDASKDAEPEGEGAAAAVTEEESLDAARDNSLGTESSERTSDESDAEIGKIEDIIEGGAIMVNVDPDIPVPSLDRPFVVYTELPQEAIDIYRDQMDTLTLSLKSNPSLANNWLQLGIVRKAIGDYEGAVEAWEYVNKISPRNNVSFFNLGDLYHFYLKDFEKAEENLLISKQNNPEYVSVYRALYELYLYSYKQDTSSAEDALLEGLRNTEDNPDLLVLLAGYYKEKGDTANARTYYEKARDEVLIRGNQSLADLLQEEIDNL